MVDQSLLDEICSQQLVLNNVIARLSLDQIHTVRPVLDGKQICALYDIKPGKMIKPLMDELISF